MHGPEFAIIPQKEKKRSLKHKIIMSVSIILGVAVILTGAYAALIYYVLLDFVTMPYITFSYRSDLENKDDITVTIDRVNVNSNYPSKFFIPRKLSGYRVTAIGESAFAGLDRLEEVTFPDTINYIGEDAFSNCINLDVFNVPRDLNYIGTNAFYNTAYLNNHSAGAVTIGPILYTYNGNLPNDTAIVKSEDSPAILTHDNYFNLEPFVQIGAGVFAGQKGITYAELPDDLEEVSDKLFYQNTNLEEVHLGSNIKHIGHQAFSGAKELSLMEWSDKIETVGNYAFKDTNFSGEVTLGENVKEIGEGAFQNSKAMTKITIPSQIKAINNFVFDGCESLSEVVFPEREFSINSQITFIGKAAFKGTAISEFTFPFSIRTLQESVLENTPNLVSVYVYNNTEDTYRIETIYDEEEDEYVDNQVTHGLTKITTNAFTNATQFKELVLVNKNRVIESPLNRVTLPITLVQLGESNVSSNLFSNTAVKVLDLRSKIRFIAPALAKNATQLEEVIFDGESRITSVYKEAFMNATQIVNFTFPESVRAASSSVFEGATSLKIVTLPTNTNFNTIDSRLFKDATSLESIIIPNNIRAIKNQAFENCISLRTISIPSSVTTMGANVFQGCHEDLQITIYTHNENMRNWDANWLGSTLSLIENVTFVEED